MIYPIKFFSDRIVDELPYPALTRWSAKPYTPEWRQFGDHWPFTVPADLVDHCKLHGIPTHLNPDQGYYIVALKFFDFSIDYFSLISATVIDKIKTGQVTVLFWYDEGDNPAHIKQRLDLLCQANHLPINGYKFVSANSQADNFDNFVYFAGDELLYWSRNNRCPALPIHTDYRQKEFTALSRTDKSWRAIIMADLQRSGILNRSYWSYHTQNSLNESLYDNPIEAWRFDYLLEDTKKFLSGAPYTCDDSTDKEQNDHTRLQPEHYNDSYCSIILETHFDVDQSNGIFITEKTFKAIKHGQPFVIAGPAGSLQLLRNLGYKTFDHAIDNSYDEEANATQRYAKLKRAIHQIQSQDMHAWFQSCLNDLDHNQQLFCSSKKDRLNTLFTKLSLK